jgi:hypothetical protein
MITSVPAPIKSRVTQAAELVSFEDAIAANLSYSGFYCTRDLEQNAELRIMLRCSPTPKDEREPTRKPRSFAGCIKIEPYS